METTFSFCTVFTHINWLTFIAAVLMAYIVGAIWYSLLFRDMWIAANQIDINVKPSKSNMVSTMLLQLLATALIGLMYFVLTPISLWLALFVTLAFGGWMKATTKFRISDTKTFIKAVIVDVTYFCIVALIFILFATF